MPRIVFSQVTFTYDHGRPFAQPLDLDLSGTGWIGLVGHNGAGKSSLLHLITGECQPQQGRIRYEPGDLRWHCIDQTTVDTSIDPRLLQFAGSQEAHAFHLRAQLALVPEQVQRWTSLSPGERQRWQVAHALFNQPDVLLCDEPSNHLDAHSRALLTRALAKFRGLGLLVSHDRDLLEQLTQRTLFLDDGIADLRPSPYFRAQIEREQEQAHRRFAHELAKQALESAKRQVQVSRQRHASAELERQTSHRQKGPRDHDARSMLQKVRTERGAASQAQKLRRAISQRDRCQAKVAAFTPFKPLHAELTVSWQAPNKRVLVHWQAADLLRLSPGPWANVTRHVALQIERDDKVWLRGANGAGKSTLLTLLGRRALELMPAQRILWLPQELDAQARSALLTKMQSFDKDERGRVLQILAQTGVEPRQVLDSANHSPGEARKLALAMGLAQQAWLVLLDEPTNHLDLPAVQALERMLLAYPGALVLITHDETLAQRTTTKVWPLAPSPAAKTPRSSICC